MQNTKSNLSSLFSWLHDEGYISANPVSKGRIKLDEIENIHLTPEEEVQVRDVPKSLKEAAIVDFLLSTGVRVGELATMNISDVDFAKGTVTFRGEKGSCWIILTSGQIQIRRCLSQIGATTAFLSG